MVEIKIDNAEEVIEKEIMPFGKGGAHIVFLAKHIGKTAIVIVKPSLKPLPLKNREKLILKIDDALKNIEKIVSRSYFTSMIKAQYPSVLKTHKKEILKGIITPEELQNLKTLLNTNYKKYH